MRIICPPYEKLSQPQDLPSLLLKRHLELLINVGPISVIPKKSTTEFK